MTTVNQGITTTSVSHLIISCHEKYKQRWDILIIICVIYNCFSIPLELSFDPATFKRPSFGYFHTIIDIAFMLDIVICFRTTYMNEYGKEIIDLKMITMHYIKGTFIIDFIAGIPIELFAKAG